MSGHLLAAPPFLIAYTILIQLPITYTITLKCAVTDNLSLHAITVRQSKVGRPDATGL